MAEETKEGRKLGTRPLELALFIVCDSCHGLSRQLPRTIVAVVTDYRDNCHTTWEALLKQAIFGICAHHLSVLPPVKEDGKVRKKQIAKTQRPHPTAGHSASRRPQEDIRPLPIIHRIYLAKPQRSLRTLPFAGAAPRAGPKDYRNYSVHHWGLSLSKTGNNR